MFFCWYRVWKMIHLAILSSVCADNRQFLSTVVQDINFESSPAFLLPHICQQPPVNHINDSTTVRKLKTTNIRKQANYAVRILHPWIFFDVPAFTRLSSWLVFWGRKLFFLSSQIKCRLQIVTAGKFNVSMLSIEIVVEVGCLMSLAMWSCHVYPASTTTSQIMSKIFELIFRKT